VKVKGQFVSFLLIIDTFFVSYAVGFNSRHVLVVDPKLPPFVAKPEVKKEAKTAEKPDEKKPKDAKQETSGKPDASSKSAVKTDAATEPTKKPSATTESHKKKGTKSAHHAK